MEEIGRETLQKELHVNCGVRVRDDEKPKELQYLEAWKTYPGKSKSHYKVSGFGMILIFKH